MNAPPNQDYLLQCGRLADAYGVHIAGVADQPLIELGERTRPYFASRD